MLTRMAFWKALNEALAERDQPEILFADIHPYWAIFEQTGSHAFSDFWEAFNKALTDRGLPEAGFGDARYYRDRALDAARIQREQELRRKLKALAA